MQELDSEETLEWVENQGVKSSLQRDNVIMENRKPTQEEIARLREEFMKPPFFDGLSTKRRRDTSPNTSYYQLRPEQIFPKQK